jgi:hypothetical protein
MICRHTEEEIKKGIGSHGENRDYGSAPTVYESRSMGYAARDPATPDSENYTVEEAVRVNKNLVLRVSYPNCRNCSYEGHKVLVYRNVSELDALRWRKIDPHFKDPKAKVQPNAAPSPVARFPASPEGWKWALEFARTILVNEF